MSRGNSKGLSKGTAPRVAAARTIATVMAGASLDQALHHAADAHARDLGDRDAALYRELCFGTLRHQPRLQALLDHLLTKPLRDREIQALAWIGLYQLMEMRVPAHAAVDATVNAAKGLRKRSAMGLLNAVLRRFQRESDTLLGRLRPPEAAAHPSWLWDALDAWPEHREAIAAANNERPPMTLRVNRRLGSRENYLALLDAADIEAAAGTLSDDAITLARAMDVSALPGFDRGRCSVQDEGAQLAAPLLAPRSGEKILDACAAPGGKTCHLLELAPEASVTALDNSAVRLERVHENLRRLQLSANVLCGDGRNPDESLKEQGPFDAILLDAPCSASGVIRRHPDIKLLRREEDVAGFAAQQRDLLSGLWPLLRPGGRLLYVTCSILPGENGDVVADFLARQHDARERSLQIAAGMECVHGRQLLPRRGGPDGLYYAMLDKER